MDRQSELESTKEELRKHLDHLRLLSQFLDKIQRLLPKETIPETKLEADKMIKNFKVYYLNSIFHSSIRKIALILFISCRPFSRKFTKNKLS